MVTKTMPIETASGSTAGSSAAVKDRGAKNPGTGGGFSDVLGNVGGGNRKQQGLSGSSVKSDNGGRTAGEQGSAQQMQRGEFSYAQKASETVREVREPGTAYSFSETPRRVITAENGATFDESTADLLLAQAARIVTKTVAATGETPVKQEAAQMLAEALAELKPAYVPGQGSTDVKTDIPVNIAGSENTDTAGSTGISDDTALLIDTLIQAVETVCGETEQAAQVQPDVTAEDEVPEDGKEQSGSDIFADLSREEALVTTDETDAYIVRNAEDTAFPNVSPDVRNIKENDDPGQLYTDVKFKREPELSDYVSEAATEEPELSGVVSDTINITDGKEENVRPGKAKPGDKQPKAVAARVDITEKTDKKTVRESIPDDIRNETAQTVTNEIPLNTQLGLQSDIPVYEQIMSAAEEEEPIPEFNAARDLPKGYSVVRQVFAAPDKGLPVPDVKVTETEGSFSDSIFGTQTPEPVKETLRMLGEVIDEAKRELGLTEVRIEYTQGDTEEIPQMIPGDHVKLSRQMNGRDGTNELDHILNEGVTDKPEREAPGTADRDTVKLSEQFINVRTDAHLPASGIGEFRDEAQTVARPPEVQLTEQILDRMDEMQTLQRDRTEFTMVLNPESLGKITVKLVMAGEKTSVEIAAENPDTRALLASRTEALQNMLKDNGVQLERYQVVSEREDTAFEQQNYDGSSKNPYGRNDGEQQRESDDNDSSFYDLLQSI